MVPDGMVETNAASLKHHACHAARITEGEMKAEAKERLPAKEKQERRKLKSDGWRVASMRRREQERWGIFLL